jgi:N-acetylneuraminic acid mutarotase
MIRKILLLVLVFVSGGARAALSWRQLPPLPDPCGFSSPFAGVSGGALIVAGGANFPDEPLWEGGEKKWHDRVFALAPGAAQWRVAGALPRPLAGGVSATTARGVLCAGGGDGERNYAEVFLLRFQGGASSGGIGAAGGVGEAGGIVIERCPPLPVPLALAAGARAGNVLYVAGGVERPGADAAPVRAFFALDLSDIAAGWKTLAPWSGPGRFQAIAAARGDEFYLFSGLAREFAASGAARLVYLADAHRYSPATGWEKLPDLPCAAQAAASPAPVADNGDIFLLGGADAAWAGGAPGEFRQVPRRVQIFSPRTNTWRAGGAMPVARACVATTVWGGAWILPTGERSAGCRSPEVWSARLAGD